MLLQTYFERIYKHTLSGAYYPSRRNAGILVLRCLCVAGSSRFNFIKGKRYTSDDVPLERKYFDGSRTMTQDIKDSFHNFDVDAVAAVLLELIDKDQIRDAMLDFGIPPSLDERPDCFCRALAFQLKGFITSQTDEANDIVLLEYQRLLSEPQATANPAQSVGAPLYPDDQVYCKSKFRPTYDVDIYQGFQHTWEFENTGTQTWRGRKLFYINHETARPRADHIYIDIPDTPPNKGVKLTVTMDPRGFEGTHECKWVMIDSGGDNCFPNSNQLSFVVHTRFVIEK